MTRGNGGATADLATMRILPPEDVWYFPRFPDRTMIVAFTDLDSSIHTFIEMNRGTLISGDLWLGTWVNPETRACFLDLITCNPDEQEALSLARRYSEDGGRKIIAICNPIRQQTRAVWDEVDPLPRRLSTEGR